MSEENALKTFLGTNTVAELRQQCSKRNIPVTPGKKTNLISKLVVYLKDHPDDELNEIANAEENKEVSEMEEDIVTLDETGGDDELEENDAEEEDKNELEDAGEEHDEDGNDAEVMETDEVECEEENVEEEEEEEEQDDKQENEENNEEEDNEEEEETSDKVTTKEITSKETGAEDEVETTTPRKEDNSVEMKRIKKFAEDVIDLLRHSPQCRLPYVKFISSYQQHFGRQCRLAEYGCYKLGELLKAIPGVVQVQGKGEQKIISLKEPDSSKETGEMAEASPLKEKSAGELRRIKQFAEELIDLLRHSPQCRLPYIKFISSYHHHFGRQCRLADYGCYKLIELLEALPGVVQILGKGDQRIVCLRESESCKTDDKEKLKTSNGGGGCYRCGEEGHYARECPNSEEWGGGSKEADKNVKPRRFKAGTLHNYMRIYKRRRTVVVLPVTIDDLSNEVFQQFLKNDEIEHTNFSFPNWPTSMGTMVLIYKTMDNAADASTNFPKFKDDVECVRLDMFTDIRDVLTQRGKKENIVSGSVEKRFVCAHYVPEGTSEEVLKSHFPEARNFIWGYDEMDEYQGLVFIGYGSPEEAEKEFNRLKNTKICIDETPLFFTTVFEGNSDLPVLDEETSQKLLKRKRESNQKPDKYRSSISNDERRDLLDDINKIQDGLTSDFRPRRSQKYRALPKGNRSDSGSQRSRQDNRPPQRDRNYHRSPPRRRHESPPGRMGPQDTQFPASNFGNQQMQPQGGIGQSPRINPQATANAVSLLVGLSNILGQRQQQGQFQQQSMPQQQGQQYYQEEWVGGFEEGPAKKRSRFSGGGGACYVCGEDGHFARECPNNTGRSGGSKGGGGGGGACYVCGEDGHFARECPNNTGGSGGSKGGSGGRRY